MHVKFDDKEPGSETPQQDESFADIQVTEDTPEPDQTMIGLLTVIEPATVDEALSDDGWILAMQEELKSLIRLEPFNH